MPSKIRYAEPVRCQGARAPSEGLGGGWRGLGEGLGGVWFWGWQAALRKPYTPLAVGLRFEASPEGGIPYAPGGTERQRTLSARLEMACFMARSKS
jgi:hypothetical protein